MFVFLAAFLPVAFADDSVQDMLNNIPVIETKAPEPTEEKKPDDDDLGEIDLPTYTRSVNEAVVAVWKPKKSLVKKMPDLEAHLLIKLHSDGTLMGVGATKVSPEEDWNEGCIKAIKAAVPLPNPPVTLRAEAARGIEWICAAKNAP
jgi:hypothetical protein